MATPAADPKAAPLSDDLREYALSLPSSGFPKNFFCTLCNELAIDPYKLLCCNKTICSSCQAKLEYPTTCPSCDHSPLEADSCTPNKGQRNTMRVWLQKQKKKEGAKVAAQAETTPVEATPVAPEVQPANDTANKPVTSIEETSHAGGADIEQTAAENATVANQHAVSGAQQLNEESTSPLTGETERRGSVASQSLSKDTAPPTHDTPADEQTSLNGSAGGMMGNNPMISNGMSGQMGYGVPNQAGFNNGMGWNGMSGMPNMMGNGGWNNMNPMDYNNMNNMNGMSNGMYGNFGGNMGMGMNDMSAMTYGGGYGGYNGMGGGYGNYNGFNQMGGYNQSGAYPEMMNQFPKNNFQNQNQSRFNASQGGAFPQRNMRNGNHGSFGPGYQNANSRPGSRSGPSQNVRRFHDAPPKPSRSVVSKSPTPSAATDKCVSQQRDGQSPNGTANTASEAKADEQAKAPAESTEEGKANNESIAGSVDVQGAQEAASSGDNDNDITVATNAGGEGDNETTHTSGLNAIQTFETGDADMQDFVQPMMGNDMSYPQGMMDDSFDPNMNMGYNNNYGPHGGFNNGAYGAAKVLVDQPAEPIGVGVVGAPTGPRAMREGRPNTGFSSRVNSARFNPPPAPKSVTPARDAAPSSPQRRVRSRSPLRDENLRMKDKSPSRSRSRPRDEIDGQHRERPRSAEGEPRREERGRSPTPKDQEEFQPRKEHRSHRSSRYDDRGAEYDDRVREDKQSRGDRTRSASAESKYRSSRRDKETHRSSRSHRDRSKEHRRRHRSRSPVEGKYEDEEVIANGEKESDGSSRRKHRSDKDKYRDRSRDKDRERDRKDRKERDRDHDHERLRDNDRDRKRRRDREGEEDEREYDDDKHRSSRRSRKDRERDRSSRHDERERDDRDHKTEKSEKSGKAKPVLQDREEDVVGQMMKKRPVSPPLNAPTGPSANGFSIKGRSKTTMPPPTQAPTGPRAFQPPKGPAADRKRERSEPKDHRRKSSTSSVPTGPATTPKKDTATQDHYAAERERNARERDSRDRVDKAPRDSTSSKSLHSRINTSSSRPSLSSKRSYEDIDDAPRGPKAESKPPTGPASHRDKRRRSGATGDDGIPNLFTAGLRKKATATRRGGVRTEGDVEREMERVERERERR